MSNKQILFIGALEARNKDKTVGGLYTACSTLCDELVKHNIDVVKLNTTYASESVGKKISLYNKITTLITRTILFIFKIFKHKRAKNILMFISAGNSYIDKIPFVLASKITKKNIIVFPRSGFLIRDFDNKFLAIFIRYVLKSANTIVCQSNFWKEYFISKGIPEKKLVVIENWVPDNIVEQSKMVNFSSYNENDKFKIVFVSRIEKMKGVDDLLELAKELKSFKLNCHISIYGTGKYMEEFRKKLYLNHLSDFITLKGWLATKEKSHILNQYHLAIFTSRFEGYPNTLLDFIFSKIPVISTNINCNVAVGKEFMEYYNPGDITELYSKVSEVHLNYHLYLEKAKALFDEKVQNNRISSSVQKILNFFR